MTPLHSPESVYRSEKEKHAAVLAALQKKQRLLGWLRLAAIVVTAVLTYQVFVAAGAWAWLVAVAGIAAFLVVISIDTDNSRKIDLVKALIRLNEEELQVLQGKFQHREDGRQYYKEHHPYANDLDVFGPASLFQYINRCSSEQGKNELAHNFLEPLTPEEIRLRQEAVQELAPQYEWRQKVQAIAAGTALSVKTERKIENWLQQKEEAFTRPFWKILVPAYSLFTLLSALAALLDYLPDGVFTFLFLLYILFSFALSKKAMAAYSSLGGIVAEVDTIGQMLRWLEEKEFRSPLLRSLQQEVRVNNSTAAAQVKELKEILNRFDMRLNVFVFLFLNSFLLWDVRQMMALNCWRQHNRETAAHWFRFIALFEILNSLAVLNFNQPQWAFPKFHQQHFAWQGLALGHPLLPESQRVTSDFSLTGTAKVALITGSNMAGKSTFLRSLGVNTVLAQLGAPVCARSLVLSPVRLMSSMRIADNLAENTSTFYAELKKLKTIIEAVKEHRPVFILLDEILRGTNSLDRHTGSKALIHQLIREQAVAVVATHDVELAKLEETYPAHVENYHFDVQVEGEELFFDYRLKGGVCTSLNASILMRKIGIDLNASG